MSDIKRLSSDPELEASSDLTDETPSSPYTVDMLLEYVRSEFGVKKYWNLTKRDFFTSTHDTDKIIDVVLEDIDELNKRSGVPEVFFHLACGKPHLYGENYSLPCTHTRLPTGIINKLSLRHACKIGTWGKYRVLLEKEYGTVQEKNENSTDDILLIIVHCNIHNLSERLRIIDYSKKLYGKLLHKVGVKEILLLSANGYTDIHDFRHKQHIHPHHEHWNPQYVALMMKKIYSKYPNSIVLTHRYIGSLLLDNELFFKMHFLINIDNSITMNRCFSDVYRYFVTKEGESL